MMANKTLLVAVLATASLLVSAGCSQGPPKSADGVPNGDVEQDLNCDDIQETNIDVTAGDPHGFDGYDDDGIGCEE
jgi:hypothetical protein